MTTVTFNFRTLDVSSWRTMLIKLNDDLTYPDITLPLGSQFYATSSISQCKVYTLTDSSMTFLLDVSLKKFSPGPILPEKALIRVVASNFIPVFNKRLNFFCGNIDFFLKKMPRFFPDHSVEVGNLGFFMNHHRMRLFLLTENFDPYTQLDPDLDEVVLLKNWYRYMSRQTALKAMTRLISWEIDKFTVPRHDMSPMLKLCIPEDIVYAISTMTTVNPVFRKEMMRHVVVSASDSGKNVTVAKKNILDFSKGHGI